MNKMELFRSFDELGLGSAKRGLRRKKEIRTNVSDYQV